MMPTQITDHLAQGLLRLLEQYKNKPKIEGLLTSLMQPSQDMEDASFAMYARTLAAATGVTLENIGQFAGVIRIAGESDDDLRARIYVQLIRNNSQGTPEAIIAGALLVAPDAVVQLVEYANAAFSLSMLGTVLTQDQVDSLYEIVRQVKSAGTSFNGVTLAPDYPATKYFAFAGSDTSSGGFGDHSDPSVGGVWVDSAVES